METCLAHDPFSQTCQQKLDHAMFGCVTCTIFLHARFIFIKKAQMGTEGIWAMAAAVD